MRASIILPLAAIALATGAAASAAPPEGKGGGKGGDKDPPAEPFVPAIAYFESGRKSKDLKLANRAGDQACLVLRSESGTPTLRGFVYHAASKTLAYSVDNQGIYLTTWSDDPCVVEPSTLIVPRAGSGFEFMDFSPDGSLLTWGEGDPDYTGFGSSYFIQIYNVGTGALTQLDLEQWGGPRPEWGVVNEWTAGIVHFSGDFATSNEIVFSGGPLDGSQGAYNSLFAYDIDETSAPRKFFDGVGDVIGVFMSASNPIGAEEPRIAIEKGPIRQIAVSDGSEGPTIDGSEPAYSCDNTEIIHKRATGKGGKSEIVISSADGSSSEVWSSGPYRFFDWFCP